MSRPVGLTPLAEADVAREQDDYKSREPGLGNRFAAQVRSTLTRIGQNPFQYQIVLNSLGNRRAPIHRFPFAVWYQALPDESVVIACLAHRQDPSLARRRTLRRVEPT